MILIYFILWAIVGFLIFSINANKITEFAENSESNYNNFCLLISIVFFSGPIIWVMFLWHELDIE